MLDEFLSVGLNSPFVNLHYAFDADFTNKVYTSRTLLMDGRLDTVSITHSTSIQAWATPISMEAFPVVDGP